MMGELEGLGGGGGWAAGGRLYSPLRLFVLAMSPRRAKDRPKHA